MLRKGDWIVVPKHNANGEVVDVSLSTVKVRKLRNSPQKARREKVVVPFGRAAQNKAMILVIFIDNLYLAFTKRGKLHAYAVKGIFQMFKLIVIGVAVLRRIRRSITCNSTRVT